MLWCAHVGRQCGLRSGRLKHAGLFRHRQSIVNSLQDTDISIRRRSLDLLFAMCNKGNVREIVAELLSYLQASILEATKILSLCSGQEEAHQHEQHHYWNLNCRLSGPRAHFCDLTGNCSGT